MIGATACFGSTKGKPVMVVLTMLDDDNGTVDLWLFRERASAVRYFVACAEREVENGQFQPDDEGPDGDDNCPRQGVPAIATWLDERGWWYYDDAICWRLHEAAVEDAPVTLPRVRPPRLLSKAVRTEVIGKLTARFMANVLAEAVDGSGKHSLAVIGERGFHGYRDLSDAQLIRAASKAGIHAPTSCKYTPPRV